MSTETEDTINHDRSIDTMEERITESVTESVRKEIDNLSHKVDELASMIKKLFKAELGG